MSRWGKAASLALCFLAYEPASAEPLTCVDVALVLAIDGSGSVTDTEFQFQKSAIAAAFRDDTVKAFLRNAGTVAIAAVFWGDGDLPTQNLGWFIIPPGSSGETFARNLEMTERRVDGDTSIGSGLWSALDMLSDPRLCSRRSLINLSGDGRETTTPKHRLRATLYQARLRAIQMGVTINALAIIDDDEELASYYARSVVQGTGGFTMQVTDQADYALAIRRKLKRELSPQFAAENLPSRSAPH